MLAGAFAQARQLPVAAGQNFRYRFNLLQEKVMISSHIPFERTTAFAFLMVKLFSIIAVSKIYCIDIRKNYINLCSYCNCFGLVEFILTLIIRLFRSSDADGLSALLPRSAGASSHLDGFRWFGRTHVESKRLVLVPLSGDHLALAPRNAGFHVSV